MKTTTCLAFIALVCGTLLLEHQQKTIDAYRVFVTDVYKDNSKITTFESFHKVCENDSDFYIQLIHK